jgi:uncharacterized protein YbaP (TraB family)
MLACLALVAGTAAAAPSARLLLVQKDGHTALFLPETHLGTPAQDDAYFRNIIRPAFGASSALMVEHSSISWMDQSHYQDACDDENEAEHALDPALAAELQRHPPVLPAALRTVVDSDWTAQLGRFMRFQLLFIDIHTRWRAPVDKHDGLPVASVKVRNAQSGILLVQAPRHAFSVEDLGTFLHAYCALAPAERALLIGETIKRSVEVDAPEAQQTANQRRASVYRQTDTEYQQELANMHANLRGDASAAQTWTASQLAFNKFLLVQRNQAWLDALPAIMQRERLPFYALGAAHFSDTPAGPGLITLLRKTGYRVTLIDSQRALKTALAGIPPPAPPVEQVLAQHELPGSCKLEGNVQACLWTDQSTSYHVMKVQAAQPSEIWVLCYQRDGMIEPQTTCVTSMRQIAAD